MLCSWPVQYGPTCPAKSDPRSKDSVFLFPGPGPQYPPVAYNTAQAFSSDSIIPPIFPFPAIDPPWRKSPLSPFHWGADSSNLSVYAGRIPSLPGYPDP